MRALILDDEPAIGRVVCRVAQAAGCDAQAATSVEAFKALYFQSRPDIVVLDLQIGADGGVAQLRFLASVGFAGQVALMSGFDRRVLTAAERLGRDLGLEMAACIHKPFRAEEIADLFRRVATKMLRITVEQIGDALASS